MAIRPFDSRVQNLVYTLEVGIGANVLKTLLYVLFMILLSVLYVATQYSGFKDARAMDQAQVARHFARSNRLNTSFVRPASLWLLGENGRLMVETEAGARPNFHRHPDLMHPPAYPVVIGGAFKLFRTSFPLPSSHKYAPEQWVIVPLNLLFAFLSGLFLYLTGRLLFDHRTALTAATVFLLSNSVWQHAMLGTEISFLVFLSTVGVWALLMALRAARREGEDPNPQGAGFWIPVMIGAVCMGGLLLTRYAAWPMLPGVVLVLWLGCGRKGWRPAVAVLAVAAGMFVPWILRNLSVSGTPFGLAGYTILREPNDIFLRSLALDLSAFDLRRMVQARFVQTVPSLLNLSALGFSAGLSVCLFFTTYFYRFQRPVTRILRWGMLLSIALFAAVAGVFGDELLPVAQMFLPVVVLFASAFFYILLDRMQIGVRIVSMSVIGLFILLQALPMLFMIMPPRPWSYPPYMARDIGLVSSPFEPGELMVSDMPWATAWYGDVTSLYLPLDLEDFFRVNDSIHPVHGLYFTTLSRDKRYHSDLTRGPFRSWRPIMDLTQLPRGFPLTFGFPIRNGEQVMLADRNRWMVSPE